MSIFTVSSNQVQFTTEAVSASDTFIGGIRFAPDGKVRASTDAAAFYNGGIPQTGTGQVCVVDATGGLPAGTVFVNAIPVSADNKVCCSTGVAASYNNGTPYAANGAICADGLGSAAALAVYDVNVVIVGNSISAGTGSTAGAGSGFYTSSLTAGYGPALLTQAPLLSSARPQVGVQGRAVPGSTISSAAATALGSPTNWQRSTARFLSDVTNSVDSGLRQNVVLALFQLTNEIYANVGTAADAVGQLAAYCVSIKAQWPRTKIVVSTEIPANRNYFGSVGTVTQLNDELLEANELIRAQWPTWADYLIDFANMPQFFYGPIGTNPATFFAGTTLYADGTHLNNAGYQFVAGQVASILSAVSLAPEVASVGTFLRAGTTSGSPVENSSTIFGVGRGYSYSSSLSFTEYFGIADTPKIPIGGWFSCECGPQFPTQGLAVLYVTTSTTPIMFTSGSGVKIALQPLGGGAGYREITNGGGYTTIPGFVDGVVNNRYRLRRISNTGYLAELSTDGGVSWVTMYTYAPADTGGTHYAWIAPGNFAHAFRPRGFGLIA